MGCPGRPGTKPSAGIGETPSQHHPQGPAGTGRWGVSLERVSFVICIHISLITQTARQKKINHMVDKFM